MHNTEEGSKMDEKLQKKIVRQLRGIRVLLSFFMLLMLVGFAILGYLIFQVVTTINRVQDQFTNIQSQATKTLQIKDDVCSNSLVSSTSYCKN